MRNTADRNFDRLVLLTMFLATMPEQFITDEIRDRVEYLKYNLLFPAKSEEGELFMRNYSELAKANLINLPKEEDDVISVSKKGQKLAMEMLNTSLNKNEGVNFANLARGDEKKPTRPSFRASMAIEALEALNEMDQVSLHPGQLDRLHAAISNLQATAREQHVEEEETELDMSPLEEIAS